eukprot:1182918-Prorocentrum_minimum.AAC.1
MGEPLNNYNAVVGAVRAMIDPKRFGLSPAKVTISTVGVAPKIVQVAPTPHYTFVEISVVLYYPPKPLPARPNCAGPRPRRVGGCGQTPPVPVVSETLSLPAGRPPPILFSLPPFAISVVVYIYIYKHRSFPGARR